LTERTPIKVNLDMDIPVNNERYLIDTNQGSRLNSEINPNSSLNNSVSVSKGF